MLEEVKVTLYGVHGKWKAMLTLNIFHKKLRDTRSPSTDGGKTLTQDSAVSCTLNSDLWVLWNFKSKGSGKEGLGRNQAFGSTEMTPAAPLCSQGKLLALGLCAIEIYSDTKIYQLLAWESISLHWKLTALIRVWLLGVCGSCFLRS